MMRSHLDSMQCYLARHSSDLHADSHVHLADHTLARITTNSDIRNSHLVVLRAQVLHKTTNNDRTIKVSQILSNIVLRVERTYPVPCFGLIMKAGIVIARLSPDESVIVYGHTSIV